MKKVRMILDILMVLFLPLLMAYSLIGENVHEVLGICMFGMFIAHHIINRRWWTALFRRKPTAGTPGGPAYRKGKYHLAWIMNTVVNLFLAVFMILQPISGILMSKYVLKGVTISGASGTLRTIHMTLAYWGFVMMSFHLGLHVRAVSARWIKGLNKVARLGIAVIFSLIAVYGMYAFVKRGIGDYLLMKVMFAFFDFGEPKVRFLLDYAAIMMFVAELAYWIQTGLLRVNGDKRGKVSAGMKE